MSPALLLFALVLPGCKKPAPAPTPEPAVEAPMPVPAESPAVAPAPVPRLPPPSAEQLDALKRKLSVRDPEPDCAAMEAELEADPLLAWITVVKTVQMPPYAPMRAAGCILSLHAEAAHAEIAHWVRDPETQGLGRMAIARLDTLPAAVALEVVKTGLEGPLANDVREAALKSEREAVRAAAR